MGDIGLARSLADEAVALAGGLFGGLLLASGAVDLGSGWLHAKIALVAILAVYHLWCGRLLREFAAGRNRRSHVWFRWFNEFPVLILVATVLLVVFKPF